MYSDRSHAPYLRYLLVAGLTVLFFLGVSFKVHAGIDEDAGTSGGRFLSVGFGAEPQALGGAYTAATDDMFAIQWNPASVARLDDFELAAQHTEGLVDMNMQYLAGGPGELTPWFNMSWFGAFFDKGDFEGTLETNGGAFNQNTGTFDAQDYQVGFNISGPIAEKVDIGMNFKYLKSEIENYDADAFALDFGTIFRMTPHWKLGLSVRNLGQDLKFVNQEDPLPLIFAFGSSYENRIGRYLGFRFNADLKKPRDNDIGWNLGGELNIINRFALRLGYNSLDDLEDGLSFGLGMQFQKVQIDYAFTPSGDMFSDRQNFSLKVRF